MHKYYSTIGCTLLSVTGPAANPRLGGWVVKVNQRGPGWAAALLRGASSQCGLISATPDWAGRSQRKEPVNNNLRGKNRHSCSVHTTYDTTIKNVEMVNSAF